MFAGQPKAATKEQFLEQAKAARIERAQERPARPGSICYPGSHQRFPSSAAASKGVSAGIRLSPPRWRWGRCPIRLLPPQPWMYFMLPESFSLHSTPKVDKERFERLCWYIIASMDAETLQESYVSVALNKDYTVLWIQQLKGILGNCCGYLKEVRDAQAPDDGFLADANPQTGVPPKDAKSLMLHLHVLVTFTSTSSWKVLKDKTYEPLRPVLSQLCASVGSHLMGKGSLYGALQALLLRGLARAKPSLKRAPLVATINLTLRPLLIGQFSEDLMNLFLLHILSVPALVHHLLSIAPEAVTLLNSHGLFRRSLDILGGGAKHAHPLQRPRGELRPNLNSRLLDFVHVSTKLLESCQKYVVNKRSNLTHWHPILGWFAQSIDHGLHESLTFVKQQLQLLWCGPPGQGPVQPAGRAAGTERQFQFLLERSTNVAESTARCAHWCPQLSCKCQCRQPAEKRPWSGRRLVGRAVCNTDGWEAPEVTAVALTCALFETALAGLTQLRLDILTGLCHHEWVLCQLWQLIRSVGSASGVRAFLDLLAFTTKPTGPEFRLLVLFCDCATHLVTILDDLELYEQQRPFTLDDLVAISAFLNTFVFRLVWNGLIDLKTVNTNQLFCSCHTLLMLLYKRDCRRSYTPPDHWLIKDVKVSTFMSDLEKGKKAAQVLLQKVPHIIPHKGGQSLFGWHVLSIHFVGFIEIVLPFLL
ncbi:hypothetical protein MRX96_035051 [Rhipicephalus microplus]